MNNESREMLSELVEDFCRRAQLYGCDAVQVLMSIHDERDGTLSKNFGRGNWYARQGMAQEFITEENSRVDGYVKSTEYGGDNDG